MVSLLDLWLPILLAAVSVFLASSVIHMVLHAHKGDFARLPEEESVLDAMRTARVGPGEYMFPGCNSMAEMSTPEHIQKMQRGPVGTLCVLQNGPFNLGRFLGQWFAYCLLISVVLGYVLALVLPGGAAFGHIFHLAFSGSLLAYAFSNVPNSIWRGVAWRTTGRYLVDGVVYGLVTGLTFALLWPAA